MNRFVRVKPIGLLLLLLLGCDGGPSEPSGNSLRVTIMGLPAGAAAAVTISGPNGFSQSASASQTFTQLTPGIYTVTAASVTFSSATYSPSPSTQDVPVGGNQVNATVTYSQTTGSLALTISGLGTASTAAVTVTGPGYTQAVSRTTTLRGLNPGSYVISARDTTAAGGTAHTASPTSQTVSITARTTATASVSYTPPPADGTVNLRIAGMYLTQSAQTYAGSVPLVRNRDGYLRVFVVGDRVNAAAPEVKVRFYHGLLPVDSATILAPGVGAPTTVDESLLTYSWNVPVPGSLIQPTLSIQAEVDPFGTVMETDETDNLYPAGTPPALDVRTVPAVNITFVPVIQSGLPESRAKGNVTESNKAQFLQVTQGMHPVSSFNAVVHADYTTTTTDTLQSQNANGAWSEILNELDVLRVTENSTNYYYGVARVSYQSGVAGVAYVSTSTVGGRAALGWDYLPSGSLVAAHELGHSWGRNHAPCGGPQQVDLQYPHLDGTTGIYGIDVAAQTLQQPDLGDVMGYCDPKWISDYTYRGVLNYLLSPSPPIMGGPGSQAAQPCLVVWGHIRNGEVVLEPAFQATTRPSLPRRSGPYTVSGTAADGSTVFSVSFTPQEIADAGSGRQNFVFAVPLAATQAARLSSIRVVGSGRSAVRSAAAPAAGTPAGIAVHRTGAGKVALRWNHQANPLVVVRDPDNGQILSLARGGEVQLSTKKGQVDLVISDGVRSRVQRMRVAR
ncbi:MAG TPA: zinc-dependent metalloprotease family protein [Gemmatimonadales bacterium]|nr:zinc-dependent metalloprotease family protein [Gemmatimonadales bacterium]